MDGNSTMLYNCDSSIMYTYNILHSFHCFLFKSMAHLLPAYFLFPKFFSQLMQKSSSNFLLLPWQSSNLRLLELVFLPTKATASSSIHHSWWREDVLRR